MGTLLTYAIIPPGRQPSPAEHFAHQGSQPYVFDSYKQRYAMSERGQLIGHKQTILEWIAAA